MHKMAHYTTATLNTQYDGLNQQSSWAQQDFFKGWAN